MSLCCGALLPTEDSDSFGEGHSLATLGEACEGRQDRAFGRQSTQGE